MWVFVYLFETDELLCTFLNMTGTFQNVLGEDRIYISVNFQRSGMYLNPHLFLLQTC